MPVVCLSQVNDANVRLCLVSHCIKVAGIADMGVDDDDVVVGPATSIFETKWKTSAPELH
jgi:hypothetical protein